MNNDPTDFELANSNSHQLSLRFCPCLLFFSFLPAFGMNHEQQPIAFTPSSESKSLSTTEPHLYSTSCGYCGHGYDEEGLWPTIQQQEYFEVRPPVEGLLFQYNYLLNVFTTPDMAKYLAEAEITEDVYALPIHLQRLLSEVKEEVVLKRINKEHIEQQQQPSMAMVRLERVRNYVWIQSGGDVANLMSALTELMSDEDELENVLGF